MLSRSILVVSLAVALLGLPACQGNQKKTKTKPVSASVTPLPIQAHYTDTQFGPEQLTYKLVNSREELKALGSEGLSAIDTDFSKHSLVVIGLGQRPTGGYWVRITGVQKQGDMLNVQGIANRPGPDAMTTQVITTPYDAVVIDKVTGVGLNYPELESVQDQEMTTSPTLPVAPADAPADGEKDAEGGNGDEGMGEDGM